MRCLWLVNLRTIVLLSHVIGDVVANKLDILFESLFNVALTTNNKH